MAFVGHRNGTRQVTFLSNPHANFQVNNSAFRFKRNGNVMDQSEQGVHAFRNDLRNRFVFERRVNSIICRYRDRPVFKGNDSYFRPVTVYQDYLSYRCHLVNCFIIELSFSVSNFCHGNVTITQVSSHGRMNLLWVLSSVNFNFHALFRSGDPFVARTKDNGDDTYLKRGSHAVTSLGPFVTASVHVNQYSHYQYVYGNRSSIIPSDMLINVSYLCFRITTGESIHSILSYRDQDYNQYQISLYTLRSRGALYNIVSRRTFAVNGNILSYAIRENYYHGIFYGNNFHVFPVVAVLQSHSVVTPLKRVRQLSFHFRHCVDVDKRNRFFATHCHLAIVFRGNDGAHVYKDSDGNRLNVLQDLITVFRLSVLLFGLVPCSERDSRFPIQFHSICHVGNFTVLFRAVNFSNFMSENDGSATDFRLCVFNRYDNFKGVTYGCRQYIGQRVLPSFIGRSSNPSRFTVPTCICQVYKVGAGAVRGRRSILCNLEFFGISGQVVRSSVYGALGREDCV